MSEHYRLGQQVRRAKALLAQRWWFDNYWARLYTAGPYGRMMQATEECQAERLAEWKEDYDAWVR